MAESNPFARLLAGEISFDQLQGELRAKAIADARKRGLEPSLFGKWRHSSLMSGGINLTIENYLFLMNDGRFQGSSKSFGGSTFVDQYGNWAGTSSMRTDERPGKQGSWTAKNGVLVRAYDGEFRISTKYELKGASLFFHIGSEIKLYKRA